jgi:hypothetical protein
MPVGLFREEGWVQVDYGTGTTIPGREGGWAAVVAFCSTLMMIVLGIAAKLRRGSDLSES